MWNSLLMVSSCTNGRNRGGKLPGYKVCEASADNAEANTHLGRMLSSGMDCVKCGWVMGRYLKNRKRIEVSHDLPRLQSPLIPLHWQKAGLNPLKLQKPLSSRSSQYYFSGNLGTQNTLGNSAPGAKFCLHLRLPLDLKNLDTFFSCNLHSKINTVTQVQS